MNRNIAIPGENWATGLLINPRYKWSPISMALWFQCRITSFPEMIVGLDKNRRAYNSQDYAFATIKIRVFALYYEL